MFEVKKQQGPLYSLFFHYTGCIVLNPVLKRVTVEPGFRLPAFKLIRNHDVSMRIRLTAVHAGSQGFRLCLHAMVYGNHFCKNCAAFTCSK